MQQSINKFKMTDSLSNNSKFGKLKSKLQIRANCLNQQGQTGSKGLSINLRTNQQYILAINLSENQKQQLSLGPNNTYNLTVQQITDQKSLSFKIDFLQDRSLKQSKTQKEENCQVKYNERKQICETMKDTNTDSVLMQFGLLQKLAEIPQYVESNYVQTPKNKKDIPLEQHLKTNSVQHYSSQILSPLTQQVDVTNLSYSRTTYQMSNLKTLNNRIRDNYLRIERLRFDQWSQHKKIHRYKQITQTLSVGRKNTSISKKSQVNQKTSMKNFQNKVQKCEIPASTKRENISQMEGYCKADFLIKEIRTYLSTFKDESTINYQKLDANKSYLRQTKPSQSKNPIHSGSVNRLSPWKDNIKH